MGNISKIYFEQSSLILNLFNCHTDMGSINLKQNLQMILLSLTILYLSLKVLAPFLQCPHWLRDITVVKPHCIGDDSPTSGARQVCHCRTECGSNIGQMSPGTAYTTEWIHLGQVSLSTASSTTVYCTLYNVAPILGRSHQVL